MESTYKEINSNQDGYLSFEELKKGYKKIHGRMTEETIGIFQQMVTDGSGSTNYQESITAAVDAR